MHKATKPIFRQQLSLALLCLGLSACGLQKDQSVIEGGLHTVHVANQPIRVELALTIAERQAGLKHRTNLPANQGMLFLFEHPQRLSFWMQNTHIPLDIAYITGDGIVREIHQMYPNVTVPAVSARDDIVMALEMNEGWFANKGILPGDRIELIEVQRAIRRRGDDPGVFPLETTSSIRR